MRISTKHAGLIRKGIVRADSHIKLMVMGINNITDYKLVNEFVDMIERDIPRHPLTMRAYSMYCKRRTDVNNRKATRNRVRIVEGFHD